MNNNSKSSILIRWTNVAYYTGNLDEFYTSIISALTPITSSHLIINFNKLRHIHNHTDIHTEHQAPLISLHIELT